MHEIGVMNGILEAAFTAAREAGAKRIAEIRVTIGELTEIQEDSLDFAFEALTPDTMADGAMLTITKLPARSHCRDCETDYDHGRFEMACPECGGFHVDLLQGRELRIDSLEIDDDQVRRPDPGAAE